MITENKRRELDARLSDAGLDAFLTTSPAGVFYLAGAYINSQRLIPDRLAAVLWRPGRVPVLLVDELEVEAVRIQARTAEIRTYSQFAAGGAVAVAQLVAQEAARADVALGIEHRFLTLRVAEAIGQKLPQARLRGFDDEFGGLMAVKQPFEMERLEKNASCLHLALADAIGKARAGDTELKVSMDIQKSLAAAGGGGYSELGSYVASGPNAHVIHMVPGARALQRGDFVRIGCRGAYRGYHAILMRSAVVGRPTSAQARIYADLHGIYLRHLAALKPGARGAVLLEAARADYRRLGHELRIPHVGHSTGLYLQERPQFHATSQDTLREDMILTAICVLDDPHNGKFYLEDMVRVTGAGGEILGGGVPDALIEI